MSKILITGMSSPHSSIKANDRSLSFSGAMSKVLNTQGHTVFQLEPQVSWNVNDLEIYDAVIVGLSPLTSLSANKVYGALSVIDVLRDSDKLKLFIDAPEPVRIYSSLRAIAKTPTNMTKPFYSYRSGYSHANRPTVLDSLLDTVDWLLNEKWPTTLYPSLPWSGTGKVISQLPTGASESLYGINLDSYMLTLREANSDERRDKWVVDTYSTKWAKSVISTLKVSTVPIKWHKGWTDVDVEKQIAGAIGALISPHQNGGTWWTYRYVQCLNAFTPVITEWKESQALGESWSYLAAAVEEMSDQTRKELAKEQREAYIQAIPNKRDAAVQLVEALELYSRKVTKV